MSVDLKAARELADAALICHEKTIAETMYALADEVERLRADVVIPAVIVAAMRGIGGVTVERVDLRPSHPPLWSADVWNRDTTQWDAQAETPQAALDALAAKLGEHGD